MNYFKGFGEQRQNTFRETKKLFSGIWGYQCIIFRDQGSTDPHWGGPHLDAITVIILPVLSSTLMAKTVAILFRNNCLSTNLSHATA